MAEDPLTQIADLIDRKLDQRLGRVERYLDGLGRDQESTARQVAVLLRLQNVSIEESKEPAEGAQADKLWQCLKCGHRLGYYDEGADEIRIRHEDHTLWLHLGAGGHVSLPCVQCGELNTIRDEPAEG